MAELESSHLDDSRPPNGKVLFCLQDFCGLVCFSQDAGEAEGGAF